MSDPNCNITLLTGHTSGGKRYIGKMSLENMLGRDFVTNDSEEVRDYIKEVLKQLQFNS